jgi:hypothetical protein
VSARGASVDSNPASVAVYPVAPPISDLRAMVTEQAIALSWTPPTISSGASPAASFRVYRAEVPGNQASGAQLHPPLQLLGSPISAAYTDAMFEFGHIYTYSVRTVTPGGAGMVESADSNLITVEAKDVFPPAPPQNAVPVFVPAAPDMPANVDITWAINAEPDLAGYIVYRSEQPDAPGQRITPELLPVPAFRDMSIMAGRTYYYRIAAVDRSGNESAASDAVEVSIP